ncbi:ribose transport system ATP-binding protein/rhamnose transport system ATP-binding protein [Micromonospora sp. Llam0]|uniref:sugar ABC transporter ATP-binding protein n=1 Tax=Micromonospora sp. Llam0 TaxID=2485143 RepID=UPI000F488353|nr:sugar ABC transporter ATP-binding protein [Micromonospora sp. Llam0]ROO59070.1 ribose transport system ATP-binding protein/rhamnose transport system ATP-binding protein [Micromonospora sp. Llam0]
MSGSSTDRALGGSRLRVEGLARSFNGVPAVRDVSFVLGPGEILGLCGHNGAGKSTVVKMISGQLAPDNGRIVVDDTPVELRSRQAAQRLGVALVDQELSVVPALTVLENVQLGDIGTPFVNRRRSAVNRCRRILDDMGLAHIEPDQLLSSLSIGERQLIEIARALSQNARLVILDEPTATLSDAESAPVFAAIRRVAASGCAVVFVSHRLSEVLQLCDTVTVLRGGDTVATTPAAELTVDELIVQMLGEAPRRLATTRAPDDDPGHALRIDRLRVPGRVVDFTLTARAGRVYALAGQLGSGASDVLRAVAGLHPAATGVVELHGRPVPIRDPVGSARHGVAFASNDRKSEGLFLDKSITWNLVATRLPSLGRGGVLRPGRERRAARSLAQRSGLPPDRLAERAVAFSGGNQQKVFVGRCLARDDGYALLLDEPTRGVDIGGRAAIHRLLRQAAESGLVVIFASTEIEELLELGDVIVTMRDGRIVNRYDGDVDGTVLVRDMTHGAEDET